jgi:Ca2+-binding RTX toxin-like protein
MNTLDSIVTAIMADPGLRASISKKQIDLGLDAARSMNDLFLRVVAAQNLNADGIITAADMAAVGTAVRANAQDYQVFLTGHGNDEGTVTTGFHNVQNDGGTLMFGGRKFIDTVADAIYHYGFPIVGGRYVNEDGNANERAADVAGWMNYFLNGTNAKFGSDKNEVLHSGEYSDVFAAARNETFFAEGGDDQIWAGDGNDKVMAGLGNDIAGGGVGSDTLMGEAGRDKLWGEDGNDLIRGGTGNDTLGGDKGNDSLFGGQGKDTVWAGVGNDSLMGGSEEDEMGGHEGNDTLDGGSGRDTLYGDNGNDVVKGGTGGDRMHGGSGNDALSGGDGVDTLYGETGNDRLSGQAGNDILYTSAGNDTVTGGAGADKILLWEDGQGADTLVFDLGDSGKAIGTRDRVEGFQVGVDKIDLSSLGGLVFAQSDYAGGGKGSVYYDGAALRIDANGDEVTDMVIDFAWIADLRASDFLFA